jgi:hypothetical protein
MLNNKILALSLATVVVLWPYATPMGESVQQGTLKEPSFTPLNEGKECYEACIKDEQTVTEVTQFSFSGHTKIGGIRKETDDSVTKLDLANIKTIKVLQHAYTSKRYPEKDFCLIQKTSHEDAVSDGMLMPRYVVICGIEKRTGDEKAWYLSKIDEVTVEKAPMPLPEAAKKALPAKKASPVEKTVKRAAENVELQEEKSASSEPVTTELPRQPQQVNEQDQQPIEPLVIKEQYKEKQIVVVEKKASDGDISTIGHAAVNVLIAVIDLFKSVWSFIRGLFIQ